MGLTPAMVIVRPDHQEAENKFLLCGKGPGGGRCRKNETNESHNQDPRDFAKHKPSSSSF